MWLSTFTFDVHVTWFPVLPGVLLIYQPFFIWWSEFSFMISGTQLLVETSLPKSFHFLIVWIYMNLFYVKLFAVVGHKGIWLTKKKEKKGIWPTLKWSSVARRPCEPRSRLCRHPFSKVRVIASTALGPLPKAYSFALKIFITKQAPAINALAHGSTMGDFMVGWAEVRAFPAFHLSWRLSHEVHRPERTNSSFICPRGEL
jgi:hypothetical protein